MFIRNVLACVRPTCSNIVGRYVASNQSWQRYSHHNISSSPIKLNDKGYTGEVITRCIRFSVMGCFGRTEFVNIRSVNFEKLIPTRTAQKRGMMIMQTNRLYFRVKHFMVTQIYGIQLNLENNFELINLNNRTKKWFEQVAAVDQNKSNS